VSEPGRGPGPDPIEVAPVVVLVQVFPARPSSIPDIRDFVRRCLAESPLTEEGNRQVGETVFRALLDAAGPEGSIQVAFRIFPEHVEVDVLHSDNQVQARADGMAQQDPGATGGMAQQRAAASTNGDRPGQAAVGAAAFSGQAPSVSPGRGASASPEATAGDAPASSGQSQRPDTFADWMSVALRREGLTQEAAARLLGVSVKTVSRWVGGATEPRLRDLRRIQEVFGEVPLP